MPLLLLDSVDQYHADAVVLDAVDRAFGAQADVGFLVLLPVECYRAGAFDKIDTAHRYCL